MWNNFKLWFRSEFPFTRTFVLWMVIATVIGIAGGYVGAAFYLSITAVSRLFGAYPWIILLLPFGGIAIAGIYHLTQTEGYSTEGILMAVREGYHIRIRLLPVIFVSTVITHLLGGSAGREGAALQIGGTIGSNVGILFRLDDEDKRTAVLCGMAAVFSALFGTPIAATIFVLEVCVVGTFHYSALAPCGIAAFSAYFTTHMLGLEGENFTVPDCVLEAGMMARVVVLAAGCALLSILLCETMHGVSHAAQKYFPNPFLRAFVGGLIIVALTLLGGSRDYNGAGGAVIARAIEEGEAAPYAFLLKLLFTAVTIGFGFKGGEIVPTFYIGATFGCVAGPILGIPAGTAAAIGMAATFCGAVNCPIASMLLATEVFGQENLPYYAVACFVSYMLSGYSSLYRHQEMRYSKLRYEHREQPQ